MYKSAIVLLAATALSACGGGSRYSSDNAYRGAVNTPAVQFASGPLQKACISSDRKARSRARCGCIQAVANQSLSSADQKRGAKYFKNPGKLQEVRQSDNVGNERFWLAWKAFGQSAAAQCKDT